MKAQFSVLSALLLGALWSVPAMAQSSGRYDPSIEKHAGLRLDRIRAQRDAAASADAAHHNHSTLRLHRSLRTTSDYVAEPNRAREVDFLAISAKRADLRLRTNRVGLDASYAEWLSR